MRWPLLLFAFACNAEQKPAAPKASLTAEGLCEHGVLATVCPNCNPALAAVFKAKGDWCNEHGFPESFCPICKPERKGLPQTDVKDDGAPADGTKVHFKTKETARLAGIETAKATEHAGSEAVTVTAHIVYDATKLAEINARSAGIVRAVHQDIGAQVKAGAPLATIESAALGEGQSRLQAAKARVQIAEAADARQRKLVAEGIAAEKDALHASQELAAAKADLTAAASSVGMVGTSDGGSRYMLTAPIAGVVTQRRATIGRLVDTQQVLFEIVDTSAMWAELDIPEGLLQQVSKDALVTLTPEGSDSGERTSKLTAILPEIDPKTRTAKGRVPLQNEDGALRGNMYARARVALTQSQRSVFVPRASVQRAKSVSLVFVRLADDLFEARRVVTGRNDDALVEVKGRISAGDDVATTGSFLLKTETLKDSIGAGCCEVEEKK